MKHAPYLIAFSILLLMGCSDDVPLEPTSSSSRLDAPDGVPGRVTRPFWAHFETVFGAQGNPNLDCDGNPATPSFVIEGVGAGTFVGKPFGGQGPPRLEDITYLAESESDFVTQCGHAVNTMADGDVFEIDFEGGVSFDPQSGEAAFWGDWTVTSGTGRFAGATGGGTYEGTANAVTPPGGGSFARGCTCQRRSDSRDRDDHT